MIVSQSGCAQPLPLRAFQKEFCMYQLIVATAFAATVFVPSFIGIRAQTEAQVNRARRRR